MPPLAEEREGGGGRRRREGILGKRTYKASSQFEAVCSVSAFRRVSGAMLRHFVCKTNAMKEK